MSATASAGSPGDEESLFSFFFERPESGGCMRVELFSLPVNRQDRLHAGEFEKAAPAVALA